MTLRLTPFLVLLFAAPAVAGAYGKAEHAYAKTSPTQQVSVGKRLSVSAPITVGNLTVFPVIDRDATKLPEVDFVTLSESVRSGQLAFTEVDSDGQIQRLRVHNRGKRPVLAMAGDLLDGGNQDRILTKDLVIPPTDEPVIVAVNCVEKARWTEQNGGDFAYAGRAEWTLRQVVQTAKSQDATWDAVAQLNDKVRAGSDDTYVRQRHDADTEQFQRQLIERLSDKRLVGLIVARDGQFSGAELYGHPALFRRNRTQILRSHTLGAAGPVASAPSTEDAAQYLQIVMASNGQGAGTHALRSATGGVIHVASYLP